MKTLSYAYEYEYFQVSWGSYAALIPKSFSAVSSRMTARSVSLKPGALRM
jgi:hypothetical protein